jgi:hypothetical protein
MIGYNKPKASHQYRTLHMIPDTYVSNSINFVHQGEMSVMTGVMNWFPKGKYKLAHKAGLLEYNLFIPQSAADPID